MTLVLSADHGARRMDDDPVKFLLTDRVSQELLAVLVTCFFFAWLA